MRSMSPPASRSSSPEKRITKEIAAEALQRRVLLYDKQGEQHYDIISALHKSVRNSDADAALYWLGRMLQAGEDPMYVARRVVRMAVEDIGLAAPEALNLCLSARDAMHFLGSPEGELALAQAVVYLALAPKSNAVYTAYGAVTADIEATAAEPVPLHLRNAPTKLMKSLDYGKDYQYAHDVEGRVADMECLPPSLANRRYYHPTQEGREKLLAQRMEEIAASGMASAARNSRNSRVADCSTRAAHSGSGAPEGWARGPRPWSRECRPTGSLSGLRRCRWPGRGPQQGQLGDLSMLIDHRVQDHVPRSAARQGGQTRLRVREELLQRNGDVAIAESALAGIAIAAFAAQRGCFLSLRRSYN